MLKDRLSCTSHVDKHRLAKVPPEQLIGDMIDGIWIAADEVQCSSIDSEAARAKVDNFVVVLCYVSMSRHVWAPGYLHLG